MSGLLGAFFALLVCFFVVWIIVAIFVGTAVVLAYYIAWAVVIILAIKFLAG